MGVMDQGRDAGFKRRSTHILILPSTEGRRARGARSNPHKLVHNRLFKGAMDEGSGKVQKASTHIGSGVLVDVAIGERDVAVGDVEATARSELLVQQPIQRGDGSGVGRGFEWRSTHILLLILLSTERWFRGARVEHAREFSGAMNEGSGMVQKASAHI